MCSGCRRVQRASAVIDCRLKGSSASVGTRGCGTTGGHQVTSDPKVFARPFVAMRERSAEIVVSQSAEISGVVLFFEDLLCSGDQFSSRGIIPLAGKHCCLDESRLNNKKDGDITAVTDKCL